MYQLFEFTDLRDTYELDTLRCIPRILRWYDNTCKSELRSFSETLLEEVDIFHHSCQ